MTRHDVKKKLLSLGYRRSCFKFWEYRFCIEEETGVYFHVVRMPLFKRCFAKQDINGMFAFNGDFADSFWAGSESDSRLKLSLAVAGKLA